MENDFLARHPEVWIGIGLGASALVVLGGAYLRDHRRRVEKKTDNVNLDSVIREPHSEFLAAEEMLNTVKTKPEKGPTEY